jgi:hypothetical protein
MRTLPLLLALSACSGGSESTTTEPQCGAEMTWRALRSDLDRSVLSVWGRADDDVYLVGGSLGAPGGAIALHWDGKKLDEIPTGMKDTLWWVWGSPQGTDVWMVGENGTIVRWDGAHVSEVASGTAAHLYGVWGTASDDVYIVGGRPGPDEGPDDVILHWDGKALTPVAVPARGAAFFKVWGASGDDLWVSGEAGTMWHRRAGAWVDESSQIATQATLSTVHGCSASEVYTVGGQHVWRFDGSRWAPVGTEIQAFAAGVSCGQAGVLVVGSGGLKLRLDRTTGAWTDETLDAPYDTDFHGSWVSPGGQDWAVGGNYVAPVSQIDKRIGVVALRTCH